MRTLAALIITALSTGLATGQEPPSDSKPEAPAIQFQVLQSKRVDLGDRALILNRVVPPVLPPAPAPAPAAAAVVPEAGPALEEDRTPQKKQELFILSATVYDRQVTEVAWFGGQREIRIFSNIDFNLLAGMRDFETENTVYSLLLFLGNETREEIEAFNEQAAREGWPQRSYKQIPPPESFSNTRSEYTVADGEDSKAPPEEILKALEALHIFFDANRQRLAEDYAKRETARIEQERWRQEHPPVPKDTVINYWIGEGATRILDKRSVGGQP